MEIYDFGLRLQELRLKKGLSQALVAEKLGLSKGTISSYERNLKSPRIETLVELAILYNSSVDYILGIDKRTSIYIDDVPEIHQEIIKNTIDFLKSELNKYSKK